MRELEDLRILKSSHSASGSLTSRLSGTTHLPPTPRWASADESREVFSRACPPKFAERTQVGPQAASMPVVIGSGSHPFPFRTRKLSLIPPMVLHGKLCGRVGRCRQLLGPR